MDAGVKSAETAERGALLRAAITGLGTVLFCVWRRSWQDPWHLVYDLSAAPVVSAFVAEVLFQPHPRVSDREWWARGWLLLPLAVVPVGGQFLHWPISGHLFDVPVAAMGHTLGRRRSIGSLVTFWVPVLPLLYIRWQVLDVGGHHVTYNALLAAIACGAAALAAAAVVRRNRESAPF